MEKKYIYDFGEGSGQTKELLGGKGANLAKMTELGVPVPEGFTLTTETCNDYLNNDKKFPAGVWNDVKKYIKKLEQQTNKQFGGENPLLVSVRSGAAISMPGMMDTILNLGLNDKTVEFLAKKTANPRFAYDSYRRFIQMFGNVVLGIEGHKFEEKITEIKKSKKYQEDTEFKAEDWQEIISLYKKVVQDTKGYDFPQNPEKQLEQAIRAVFESWLIPRAIRYRRICNIPDDLGTAVNIQSMVFGNMGETSGTGVLFTRNPSTGENKLFGEFLMNAQGEDVVAGIRTPESIENLQTVMPKIYAEINEITQKLEHYFKDMQDIEFTIEDKKLYILQTRNGKRSATAGVKIAVDMEKEGTKNKKEALLSVDVESLDKLLHPKLDENLDKEVLTKGLPASPGAAVGKIAFSSQKAEEMSNNGDEVILVRHETSPEDITGMDVSRGILTACGGMTSHAAVVARGMGRPCVSGASDLIVDQKKNIAFIKELKLEEGDYITIDGSTGEVIKGKQKTIPAEISGDFETILSWSKEFGQMHVRTNADTPKDAQKARDFGAEGIGLCRTEHMFFDEERIFAMREMILSKTEKQREKSLEKLLPFQRTDFIGIFKAMDGYPVNIRLLDPPLHEFLPEKNREIEALAIKMGVTFETLKEQVLSLHEVNPMLGHRGCRLMISYPEIAKMQTRAIMEAACEAQKQGVRVFPEIMVPLVGVIEELKFLRKLMEEEIRQVFEEQGMSVQYKIGTMIEIPRACIVADEIAKVADYFSFGTNDLTQMTFGYSRDDVGKFLPEYLDKKFIQQDPFQTLDIEGVGRLMSIAIGKGRKTNRNIKIGICGEHGGDPKSIDFCFHHDFNYVSCSPFRVPIARIATAQSFIRKWQ